MHKSILIIGAGLTGLLLAYKLKQRGISVTILEARERLGGRIWKVPYEVLITALSTSQKISYNKSSG